MTAPFHPRHEHHQRKRKPWYDRTTTISSPFAFGISCALVQPLASDINHALGGLFVLAFLAFFAIDLWNTSRRRVR